MKYRTIFIVCCILITASCSTDKQGDKINLFDGNTLSGFEGDTTIFRVRENLIVGGDLEEWLDNSYFLCTEKEFKNFDLSLEAKLSSKNNRGNSGVNFRAHRIEGTTEVAGYQADFGFLPLSYMPLISDRDTTNLPDPYPLWGTLIDENREDSSLYPNPEFFPVAILKFADYNLIEQSLAPNDWNMIRIVANGNDIEIFFNGESSIKYKEERFLNVEGPICLQVHSGPPMEIAFRNIRIKELIE